MENRYGLVIINYYSKYTCVFILVHKSESFHVFEIFCKSVQIKQGSCIYSIRSDHDTDFKNGEFQMFCKSKGIHHNLSSSRTPQQNGVVE